MPAPRNPFAAAALLALALCASARAQDDGGADVTVIEGDGKTPRPDDVVRLGGFEGPRLFRGDAQTPRLRAKGGRVFEKDETGKETLVALNVSDGMTIAAWLLPPDDALAVPAEAFAALRGLQFDGWRPEFAPMLARIVPSKCFVGISVGVHRKLPALPDGLRALAIDGFLDEDVLDLAPLAGQTRLRLLEVEGTVTSWAPLSAMKELVRFKAEVVPGLAASVPVLPALQSFESGIGDEVSDISFVARFPVLRTLDVGWTAVTDLSPIAGLREIRNVGAAMSAVRKLPPGTVPSLRKLDVMRHSIPAEELAAFIAANPQCSVKHSWRALLDAEIAGVDGLRLRTGGQCHRSIDEEETLFRTQDAGEVRKILASISIDEPRSAGQCMCCGGPTIELLRGTVLAASVTMHHGQALRWYGWPGDGLLTPESSDALCAWLGSHGAPVDSPRMAEARVAAERKARDAAQDVLLGPGAAKQARAATDDPAFTGVIRAAVPDAAARILVLAQLAALTSPDSGDEDVEDPGAVVVERAERALGSEDGDQLVAVLLGALTRSETSADVAAAAAKAVARLPFRDDAPIPEAGRARLRIPAARWILAHAAAGRAGAQERRGAVEILRLHGTPEAAALALTLLPAPGADGAPATKPTSEQRWIAQTIAAFCAETDLPHLRAVVAASGSARRMEDFDAVVAGRKLPGK